MVASQFAEILMVVGIALGVPLFSVSDPGGALGYIGGVLGTGAVVSNFWRGWMLYEGVEHLGEEERPSSA